MILPHFHPHPELDFLGGITVAGWVRQGDLSALSGTYSRVSYAVLPHYSPYAKPPVFDGHPAGS